MIRLDDCVINIFVIIVMEDDNQFENIVPKEHPYHGLLSKTIVKCKGIFHIRQTDHLSTLQASFPLRMYCRENVDAKHATFIYFYTVPVKVEEYLKTTWSLEFQKKNENFLDEFRIYKDLNLQNTQLLFKSYKKVLIVMPRYFIYVRYAFEHKGEHWILAVSDPGAEVIKEKTKGEIIITATRAREVEGGTEISVFSQTDMKMNLKFQTAKTKGFFELKKYLEKVHAHFKQ